MGGGRTHRPELDRELCRRCGVCSWDCPARVFGSLVAESGSLRGAVFRARPYPGKPAEAPPCAMTCPLGQDVPAYVAAIADGDLERAARVVRETNALPSVCGRVCLAACIRSCTRESIDEGVDIRALKRFAAEATRDLAPPPMPRTGLGRAAVIGGGPAGLAAAHRLVQLGVEAVVFEAEQRAGGALLESVAPFVLPAGRVADDVAHLERIGVELRLGQRAGRDVEISDLEREFGAVLVATGARRGLPPPIEGRELRGATDARGFALRARSGELELEGKTLVALGGGPAALQVARWALRLGAAEAIVVHSAPRELWPGGADALSTAEREGVRVLASHRALAIAGSKGRVEGLELAELLGGDSDGVGRPRNRRLGERRRLAASTVVSARGRRPEPGDAPELPGLELGPLGTLAVDSQRRLGRSGWYAAGEAAGGASGVVDSMASGRRAAETIARDLAAGKAKRS